MWLCGILKIDISQDRQSAGKTCRVSYKEDMPVGASRFYVYADAEQQWPKSYRDRLVRSVRDIEFGYIMTVAASKQVVM